MSLRLRLTLTYSILIGVILAVFGAAVYVLVYVTLLNQVDNTLASVANDIVKVAEVNAVGQVNVIRLPPLDMTANAYVQVWGLDNELVSSSPGISALKEPLDPLSVNSDEAIYRDSTVDGVHLRALTVPLQVQGRKVGVLQAATSMVVVDSTRANLVSIIGFGAFVAILLAGFSSWMVLGRALSPLETIADTVDQINRADDLSRRIPHSARAKDEVGELVEAFNQTLERLESLFASQQRLLADVSHELRTPLTVIQASVDLIRRMKTVDDDTLSSIRQEVGRLTRLVGGLLLLAQAESGKLTLDFRPVELDLLLTEVFYEMRILAGNKVHVHLNEIDQIKVNGDRDRLKQVFLNLTANAIQYTPQDGDVFLSIAVVKDQARVIVRDTGPGIPAADLPHIFERFYRAEKSRTRSGVGGFGLGLSIVHWIVERHGGKIEVDSKEGKGTTFAIWLPLIS